MFYEWHSRLRYFIFVMSCIHYMCLSRQSFFLQPCMHNYVNCFHLEASLVYINGITYGETLLSL